MQDVPYGGYTGILVGYTAMTSLAIAETPAVYDGPFRKRMRHEGHDYRAPCTVHVTICTHHRQMLFGAIDRAGLHLNDAGGFAEASLLALHADATGIAIDTHIVMPDHVHAIIVLGTNPALTTTASIPILVEAFKMRCSRSGRSASGAAAGRRTTRICGNGRTSTR